MSAEWADSARDQLAGTRSEATDGVAITPQRKISESPTEPASGSAAAVNAWALNARAAALR